MENKDTQGMMYMTFIMATARAAGITPEKLAKMAVDEDSMEYLANFTAAFAQESIKAMASSLKKKK